MDAAGHADYFTMIQQNGNINDQKEEASIQKWTRQVKNITMMRHKSEITTQTEKQNQQL